MEGRGQVYINESRTVQVTVFEDGTAYVITRSDATRVWRAPAVCRLEEREDDPSKP